MKLFSDFVGGRLPLARVFWFYGVFVGGFLFFMVDAAKGSQALASFVAVLSLAYMLFWYVALWRSSGNYDGLLLWKLVARFVVALPLLGIVASMALTTGKTKQAAPVVQPAFQFDPSTARPVAE